MSDHVIEKAKAKRAALQRDLDKINTFLEVYDEFAADSPPSVVTAARRRRRRHVPTETDKTVQACINLITANGRPVPMGNLYNGLLAQGFEFGGAVPRNTLAARMSNSPLLVSLRPHGWWIASTPYPQLDYAPDTEDETPPGEKPGGESNNWG